MIEKGSVAAFDFFKAVDVDLSEERGVLLMLEVDWKNLLNKPVLVYYFEPAAVLVPR